MTTGDFHHRLLDATVDGADIATNFGYTLAPDYWSQGYATECSQAILEHFERQGVREVRAYVTLGNIASERVLLKSGFVRTRVIPDNDRIRGVLHDDIEYVRGARRQHQLDSVDSCDPTAALQTKVRADKSPSADISTPTGTPR